MSLRIAFMIVGAAGLVTAAGIATAAANGTAKDVTTVETETADLPLGPSGYPIPRFVSLRKDHVRARFGPSFDYPVAYEFRREGFPLKVIEEDRDDIWRRVEDRDGRRMWIHRAMLSANENAVVHASDVVLRSEPQTDAMGRARLTEGVMTKLETCSGQWCRIEAGEFRGWVQKSALWGAPI